MIRYIPIIAVGLVMPIVPIAPAAAESAQSAACLKLAYHWNMLEQNLADAAANGPKDRNMDDLTGLTAGNLLYSMMKDNQCALPTLPPSSMPYYAAALKCKGERAEVAKPQSCNRETWTKSPD